MSSQKIMGVILRGLPNTLLLLFWSLLLASLLGLLLTRMRLAKGRFWSKLADLYLNIVRGTPPLLMLLLSYYGLPFLLKGMGIDIEHWTRLMFGIFGLTIGWSAYLAEAFRSAYLSVDPGQLEAARSVGMNNRHAFLQIILPQAAVNALPNIENLVIGLVKATSLVYVLSLYDMYNEAANLSNQSAGIHQLQIFVLLALTYWMIVLIIEAIFRLIKKHFAVIS